MTKFYCCQSVIKLERSIIKVRDEFLKDLDYSLKVLREYREVIFEI